MVTIARLSWNFRSVCNACCADYICILNQICLCCSLGSTRFFKVAKAKTKEGLVVVKVFVIHDPSLPLKAYKDKLDGWFLPVIELTVLFVPSVVSDNETLFIVLAAFSNACASERVLIK